MGKTIMFKIKSVGKFIAASLYCFVVSGCAPLKPDLPPEIDIERLVFQAKISAPVGPSGLNKRFIIYELTPDTTSNLMKGRLEYINNLPSIDAKRASIVPPKIYKAEGSTDENGVYTPPMTGPWAEPFLDWQAAPIVRDERWSNKGSRGEADTEATLGSYFGNFYKDGVSAPFVTLIPDEWESLYYEAAKDPDNFYAYGGYRASNVVLLSPELGLLFFLYRA